MKYQTLGAALLLALLIGTAAAVAVGVPDTIQKTNEPSGPPAWISEEALKAAMDAKGQPVGSRLESVAHLFDHWPRLSSALDQYAEMRTFRVSPDGTLAHCEPFIESYYHEEKAKDLKQLVELSTDVTRVRVLGYKPGFLSGQAGELLEVEVLSILKDTGKEGVPRRGFYLFNRYTRMMVDGKALCLGDRQVPEGEFLLFQIWTEYPVDLGLPGYFLDSSALIAADGTFYGSLLDNGIDPAALALQLPTVSRLLDSEQP